MAASCWLFLYDLYYDARNHEHKVVLYVVTVVLCAVSVVLCVVTVVLRAVTVVLRAVTVVLCVVTVYIFKFYTPDLNGFGRKG